jgi:hypothetical protein
MQYEVVDHSAVGLQAQLETQCTELKGVVRERQDLESENATLQKQLKTDRQDHQERLLKSQTEQAVTSCELEAYKKQVLIRTFSSTLSFLVIGFFCFEKKKQTFLAGSEDERQFLLPVKRQEQRDSAFRWRTCSEH